MRNLLNIQTQKASESEVRHDMLSATASQAALKMRIDELEQDVGMLVLVLTALLTQLDDNETVNREVLKRELLELDLLDGKSDSRLTSRILRTYLHEIHAQGTTDAECTSDS